MTGDAHQKVNAGHLKRNAYLYVRQSTLRQVLENTESTKRQYGLRQHAVALGWPVERIIVIDSDLGQSGASAVDREGFQKLVTEVGLGKAGIVLGLEVSRLARNSTDWHRLLEICALTDTLILDEDGVYDPSHFNDRLLLGLKGTMSEAELHVLRARLQGGILNKARRGELQCPLPVGFVYSANNEPVLDPDKQVQESIRFFFETFRRTASACAVVKAFRQKGLLFPRRLKKGPNKGDLVWAELPHSRALHILHNPRYTGAFVYGRSRTRNNPNGGTSYTKLPREQWMLLKDTHPGYISWEQYEENLLRLREKAQAVGADRRKSPPREGPALLQGLVVCGICGSRMTVRYHTRKDRLVPEYVCQRDGIEHAISICQRVIGDQIDNAVGRLLVESVAPLALEVTLSVQQELQARVEEVDKLRKKQVERARYEADMAQRRYLHVDPANRLVADSLEADWNEKLRALTQAQEQYEQQRRQDRAVIDDQQRASINALASDFPRLWQDPKTPDRERKRMVRLLLADVTLIRGSGVTVHVRFNGGATKTLELPRPLTAWELRTTPAEVVAEIDRLTDQYTDKKIVEILNQRGALSGCGQQFNSRIVARLRHEHQLKPRYDRLREKGLLTLEEMSARLDIGPKCVITWRNHGLLHGYTGSVVQFRRAVSRLRPQIREPFLRLETLPGEQAQVDWAHFGHVLVGRARRALSCFVITLSYSRALYLEFFFDQTTENFLRGHVHAFQAWNGQPRTILYDNLKSAVLERRGSQILFNPRLIELTAHYHFTAQPCQVRAGNQKGRVERAIRYVRDSFWAGRSFTTLAECNRQAWLWRDQVAHQRRWPQQDDRKVEQVFRDEQPRLIPLPLHPFQTDRIETVCSRKTIYVRFDLNDYSIPPEAVGRPVTLVASDTAVRILDGATEIARHIRSYDRQQQVLDPRHRDAVLQLKHRAFHATPAGRLEQAVPESKTLLDLAFAQGESAGSQTSQLLKLLEEYGPAALRRAIVEALQRNTPRACSVAFLLRRQPRAPRVALDLSGHPQAQSIDVRPHDLEIYDELARTQDDDAEQ